jgi:hypothetical protein
MLSDYLLLSLETEAQSLGIATYAAISHDQQSIGHKIQQGGQFCSRSTASYRDSCRKMSSQGPTSKIVQLSSHYFFVCYL